MLCTHVLFISYPKCKHIILKVSSLVTKSKSKANAAVMNWSDNKRLLTENSEFHNNPELLHIIKDTLVYSQRYN